MRRPSNLTNSTRAANTAPAPAEPGSPKHYLDLYGLSKPPFGGSSETAGYILFGSHRRAFELLVEHLVNGSGVILLQGEEGIGKTETLRSAAAVAAESNVQTVFVSRPSNGRVDLTQFLAALNGQPSSEEKTVDAAIAYFLAPPRKALLVDDVDLMPEDCMRVLASLVELIPDDPGAQAIVLSCSSELNADPKRPDLSKLASIARDTVRLLRLGPSEVRQYIERSLWIAGGTTRRLIAPDAMKLLVARSGGAPGITNRLMEAVLMAGFARGDAMITAKTVAAAMGPTTPRPRYREPEPSGAAARTVQLAAIGLLVLGLSVFLYRGLSGRVEPSLQATSQPAAAVAPSAPPVVATPPEQARPAKQVESLSAALVAALMKHGDQSFSLGDIAAARLLYQRAADAGNAQAFTALGKTYDPNYASSGQMPDPARAAEFYRKANSLGDAHAADLLKKLAPR